MNEAITPKHRTKITQDMKSMGYKMLGKGQDARVFSKIDDTVIKILMPMSGNLLDAERTFLPFLAYCLEHKSDPHLLKFKNIQGQPFTKFTIGNESFYQIAIEKLSPIKKNTIDEAFVWLAADSIDKMDWIAFKKCVTDRKEWEYYPGKLKIDDIIKRMENVDTYKALYGTMKDVHEYGKKNDLGPDMHTENLMMRANVVVITDPWIWMEP